ncbi:MAG TPA: glycosyltransferase family 4 protein [Gemmatimonadaceae bacterium]|nr:glycosyltransferase family 4 protein [Gemmatimonadaceae bacterium]
MTAIENARARSHRASAALGVPGFAVVALGGSGDGIAYSARLADAVLRELSGDARRVIELAPRAATGVSIGERFRFTAKLIAADTRRRVDWWLFNHLSVARAYRLVPTPLRRPYGIILHGIEVWDSALSSDRRAALRGARVRIAVSAHTASKVRATHPDVGDVVACPLALLNTPASPRREADTALLARLRPRSVAIVGRMSAAERYKGHDQLLEAWPIVRERVPGAQLVIVGQGDDRARLIEKARALELGDDVLFTGFVSDATLQHVLENVAVFAMPSQGEGFGLVYLQAMAAGRACIGSDRDAAGGIIVPGETGLLVNPDDIGGVADAVATLLDNEELCRRMGAAGRRRYEAEFTYPRYRDRLGALLASAFGEQTPRRG